MSQYSNIQFIRHLSRRDYHILLSAEYEPGVCGRQWEHVLLLGKPEDGEEPRAVRHGDGGRNYRVQELRDRPQGGFH